MAPERDRVTARLEVKGEVVETRTLSKLNQFIVSNYLFGDTTRVPRSDDSLVESGIIDSTGVLELIEFLESQFGIEVTETETVPANLDTLAALTQFILRKRSVTDSAA